ncbi:MAG: hypothetical protein J5606_05925 [Bacteroidales bacterium]|nr:hypothetical protein [Bacteroidales bacterium]
MRGIIVEDGDLQIKGGSLVIGEVKAQVAEHLTRAFTGEYKHEPTLGGNAKNMIAGRPDSFWAGNVKNQLMYCKVEVERIKVVDDDIEIELK